MPKTNIDIYTKLHGSPGKVENLESKFRNMENRAKSTGMTLSGLWKQVAVGVGLTMGIPALIRGAGKLASSFLSVAVETENYEVRLKALLGSQKEAAEAMAYFEDIASKVPFTLQEVIEAGTTVIAFGADLKEWTPVLTDLAAVMGLDLVDAANALGRAYAGGAGAADIFRERGILQIIKDSAKLKHGIQDITKLSLPEFRKVMIEAFTDPKGRIAGAADDLSRTWTGMVSMLEDAWFQFRKSIMEAGIFEMLKEGLQGVLDFINEFKAAGGFEDIALHVSALGEAGKAVKEAFEAAFKWYNKISGATKDVKEKTDEYNEIIKKQTEANERMREAGFNVETQLVMLNKEIEYSTTLLETQTEKIRDVTVGWDTWGRKIVETRSIIDNATWAAENFRYNGLEPLPESILDVNKVLKEAEESVGGIAVTWKYATEEMERHGSTAQIVILSMQYAYRDFWGSMMNMLKQLSQAWAVETAMAELPYPYNIIAAVAAVAVIEAIFAEIKGYEKGGWAGLHGPEVIRVGEREPELIVPKSQITNINNQTTNMREIHLHQTFQIGTERIVDETIIKLKDKAELGTITLPVKILQ